MPDAVLPVILISINSNKKKQLPIVQNPPPTRHLIWLLLRKLDAILSLELTSPHWIQHFRRVLFTTIQNSSSRECVSRDTRTVGHLTTTRAMAYLCDACCCDCIFLVVFWRIGANLISFFISLLFCFRYSSSVRKM